MLRLNKNHKIIIILSLALLCIVFLCNFFIQRNNKADCIGVSKNFLTAANESIDLFDELFIEVDTFISNGGNHDDIVTKISEISSNNSILYSYLSVLEKYEKEKRFTFSAYDHRQLLDIFENTIKSTKDLISDYHSIDRKRKDMYELTRLQFYRYTEERLKEIEWWNESLAKPF